MLTSYLHPRLPPQLFNCRRPPLSSLGAALLPTQLSRRGAPQEHRACWLTTPRHSFWSARCRSRAAWLSWVRRGSLVPHRAQQGRHLLLVSAASLTCYRCAAHRDPQWVMAPMYYRHRLSLLRAAQCNSSSSTTPSPRRRARLLPLSRRSLRSMQRRPQHLTRLPQWPRLRRDVTPVVGLAAARHSSRVLPPLRRRLQPRLACSSRRLLTMARRSRPPSSGSSSSSGHSGSHTSMRARTSAFSNSTHTLVSYSNRRRSPSLAIPSYPLPRPTRQHVRSLKAQSPHRP